MKFTSIGNKVIIKVAKNLLTSSGIVTENRAEKIVYGEIISIGEEVKVLQKGNTVAFSKHAGKIFDKDLGIKDDYTYYTVAEHSIEFVLEDVDNKEIMEGENGRTKQAIVKAHT